MTNTTVTAAAILRPDQVGDLLVKPVRALSVATHREVATVVQTNSKTFRLPTINADPQAAWTAGGAEIAISDADLDELEVTPAKLAGLTIITNELAADSTPEAAQVVGDGLARDIDSAFFGTLWAPAPAGLEVAANHGGERPDRRRRVRLHRSRSLRRGAGPR